jgi:CRP/FNR family transcriptional regulator, dissimilatory nitrate respiration regulator
MLLEASNFRQAITANTLRSCQLFMGLPGADIAAIGRFAIPKHLAKGDYLFHEGDPAEGFYLVQKGGINVHRVNSAGKEQVIHVFYPVESFAEGTLATERGYPADARAIESSTILMIPKKDFVDLLRKRPDLALRMLGSMSQHLRVLVGLLDDLTLKDMETRLANWLLKHCPLPMDDRAIEIKLDRTKRVLAAEMGTTSETLSRMLGKFRDEKVLLIKRNTIIITRPLELARILRRHLGQF